MRGSSLMPAARWKRVLLVVGVVLLAGLTIAAVTVDRWLMAALDPGPFDPAATPPAPDYGDLGAWAAHPSLEDGADVSLPEAPGLADPAEAKADVFYVHPTTAFGTDWNVAIDRSKTVDATYRGGTLIQASAFNACCAVFGPHYRQAHGRALTHPDADGDRALDVAYGDVSAAFDAFLDQTGDRPMLVAAHSQGSVHAVRLLRERVAGSALRRRLVVAYLVGGPIRVGDLGGLPVCEAPDQTGCVVAWNARGPRYRPGGFEFHAEDPDPTKGWICVNPLTWRTDGAHAPASAHPGALFFDSPAPAIEPGFADAQCIDGVLVITRMGDPQRDFMSRLLLWMMGPDNYHPMEYQLFYMPLRQNAVERVEAFIAAADRGA